MDESPYTHTHTHMDKMGNKCVCVCKCRFVCQTWCIYDNYDDDDDDEWLKTRKKI